MYVKTILLTHIQNCYVNPELNILTFCSDLLILALIVLSGCYQYINSYSTCLLFDVGMIYFSIFLLSAFLYPNVLDVFLEHVV